MASRKKQRHMSWQDLYYDGVVDSLGEFCEDTQNLIHDVYSEIEDEDYVFHLKNKKRKKDIYDI